jgi:hypothetical protein
MTSKTQPAFWGGLLIGVLSALPFVSALNMCCCLWVIVGGVLTAYLLQDQTPLPITAGDGATAGLLAGAIGAVVAAVLGLILGLMMRGGAESLDQLAGRSDIPPEVARILERLKQLPRVIWFIGPLVVYLVLFPIFAMLGGLLGVAIFKKTAPPPPPGTVEVLPPEPPGTF